MTKNSRKRRAAKARQEALEFEMGYVGAEEAATSEQDEEDVRRVLVNPEQALDEEETKEEERGNDMGVLGKTIETAAKPVEETRVATAMFPSAAAIGWAIPKAPVQEVSPPKVPVQEVSRTAGMEAAATRTVRQEPNRPNIRKQL